MSAGHAHRLYLPGTTVVHRLPAHVKLVAALASVVAVVATPRAQFWAFAIHAILLGAVVRTARIPIPILLRRMLVEIPFVIFAVLMPVLAAGPRTEVLGVSLSVTGLYDAWNVLAKATLGVIVSIILAATTDLGDLLAGLARLRMPDLLVQIMSFMIRYADVVTDEMRRMHIARVSRGFVARDLRQLPTVARSAAALFIRVYERGERVHLAMLARGYAGRMPLLVETATTPAQWTIALGTPLACAAVATTAWMLS